MGIPIVPMVRMSPFKFAALLKIADLTSSPVMMANAFRDTYNVRDNPSVKMDPMKKCAVSFTLNAKL